ncbi:aminopeptidase P family N-terminal domain-containing protein [Rhizobium sp. BK376]|uniref:aminopeptidase P family N-terminal domain-containing protein n=1 Tax=Rhizobium sp. BK376 TaxID=2512149 RepID=UPI001045DF35|nr:aminopeptidase P family N-terminal domain-containing protein [Rhizobium sp. BK376]TCR73365.1 creatinase/prolidase-like protein [Rhizobium sp. BK376]
MPVELRHLELPDFGTPTIRPEIAKTVYEDRFHRFLTAVWARGFDAVAVYGDREHCANIAYLTGFDPRFEEALLIVAKGKKPVLLTGIENQGVARKSAIEAEVVVYKPFGLLGQDRTDTKFLPDYLAEAGLETGSRIAAVGWKYFTQKEHPKPSTCLDIPSYIADALRGFGPVGNAADVLMDSSTGLRTHIEVDEIAQFEFAATHGSEAVRRLLRNVKPGITELEASQLLAPIGLPLSAHTLLTSGESVADGLRSPSSKTIQRGDPFLIAFSYVGALTARAGFVAEGPDDLDDNIRDYVQRLAAPYFETVCDWYSTVGIGVEGGRLDALVRERLGDPFFNVLLNPGHLLHLEEWINSPVYPNSVETLHSHSALQMDIIPATGSAYQTANAEDGIVLLDERGRAEIREKYPDCWDRMRARREFMVEYLGISLREEVMPMSNLCGYLTPFILARNLAFVRT